MTVQHSIAVESLLLNPENYGRLDPASEQSLSRLVCEQGSTINADFDVISVFEDFNDVGIAGVGIWVSA